MTHGIEIDGRCNIPASENSTLRESLALLGSLCLTICANRYVYHVHANDYEGFVKAIKKASTTEIPSFIPKHMTELAVRERLRILMETDWKTQAALLLEERKNETERGLKPYVSISTAISISRIYLQPRQVFEL